MIFSKQQRLIESDGAIPTAASVKKKRGLFDGGAVLALLIAALITGGWLMRSSYAEGPSRYYVTQNGSGNGDSWDSAMNGAAMLAMLKDIKVSADATKNYEIWVASGDYLLTETLPLTKGVKLYGGFAGNETALASRDLAAIAANKTVLSRDAAVNSDIKFSIILCSPDISANGATSADTIIDGFTITGGNADAWGGGMCNRECSPTITNCTFINNKANINGGGIKNYASGSKITNCSFISNEAGAEGGGICNDSHASPVITNCTFAGNKAGDGGGAANTSSGSPKYINCTFSGNILGGFSVNGAGMYNQYGMNTSIINCIFRDDLSGNKAEIYNCDYKSESHRGTITIKNTVLQNAAITSTSCDYLTIDSADITSADPQLLQTTPQDNGGPVPTIAISAKGSAFRAGLKPGSEVKSGDILLGIIPTADARGVSFDATSADIGAYAYKPVTSITLSVVSADMAQGTEKQLTASVAPQEALGQTVIWTTGNAAIATVTPEGIVKAIAPGEVTITATANGDSNIKAECKIVVSPSSTPSTGGSGGCNAGAGAAALIIAALPVALKRRKK